MELEEMFDKLRAEYTTLQNKLTASDKLVNSLKAEAVVLQRNIGMVQTERDEITRKFNKVQKLFQEGVK